MIMFSKFNYKKRVLKLYENLTSCHDECIDVKKLHDGIESIVTTLHKKYNTNSKHFIDYINIIISTYPIIYLLIDKFNLFDLETKICVVKLISYVLYTSGGVFFFLQHPFIIDEIFYHFREDDITLNIGHIIQEFVKHKDIVQIILFTPSVYLLFLIIRDDIVEKSALSFEIVNTIFQEHKYMVDYFLQYNYDRFIEMYLSLLKSKNYIVVRKGLDLLYFIITHYKYFNERFIQSIDNMKLIASFQNNPSEKIQASAYKIYDLFIKKFDEKLSCHHDKNNKA